MRRTVGMIIALMCLAVGLVPAEAANARCPAAKTCPAYSLETYRWPVAQGKPLVIPYYVSTKLSGVTFAATDLPPVVRAATRVWERANPRIRFQYRGLTDALPGPVMDGMNVIGFGPNWGLPLLEAADAPITYTQAGRLREADISIDPDSLWVWQPCPQRNGGCAGHSRFLVPPLTVWGPELQGVIEHELGHWLSLGHADDSFGADALEMTMYSVNRGEENLTVQTLGLGDVLGVRAAYPCGRCGGPPVVYSP